MWGDAVWAASDDGRMRSCSARLGSLIAMRCDPSPLTPPLSPVAGGEGASWGYRVRALAPVAGGKGARRDSHFRALAASRSRFRALATPVPASARARLPLPRAGEGWGEGAEPAHDDVRSFLASRAREVAWKIRD
jgi:hypothetical protein